MTDKGQELSSQYLFKALVAISQNNSAWGMFFSLYTAET
jgi:hypothetical protein